MDIVNDDPTICAVTKPLEYLPVANSMPFVTFLSNQPLSWREFTLQWLERRMKTQWHAIFVNSPRSKIEILNKNDLLIDDYPMFHDYSKVLLVDRPYNRDTKAIIRIMSPNDLREFLATKSIYSNDDI